MLLEPNAQHIIHQTTSEMRERKKNNKGRHINLCHQYIMNLKPFCHPTKKEI